jgi:inner membrane protein
VTILWWHWLVLGLVLIGLELVVPSFTIIWFGLGAVLVGIILALVPGFPLGAQILTWTVASALMTFAWFRFLNPRTRNYAVSKTEVIGETGLVVRAAAPGARGTVRFQLPLLGGDVWPCISDEALDVGDRVRVVDMEDRVMKVEKTERGKQ